MVSQRISSTNPRYIKHPGSESGWVSDGEPLDSGSGIIISNNLAHLKEESCKHLLHVTGDIYPAQDSLDGWSGITDGSFVPGDPSAQGEELQISWARRTSMVFGPFVIPQDNELGDGTRTLRKIVLHIGTYNGTGTDLKILCFLTPNKSNPSLGYLAKSTTSTSVSGKVYKRLVLEPVAPTLENFPMLAENGNISQVRQVYLWIGFLMPINSDVLSVSAFESR